MFYYIVAAVILLAVVGIAAVLLTDATVAQWRCLRRVRRADRLLDSDPQQVRRVCSTVCRKLDRIARRTDAKADGLSGLPNNSHGLEAYAHAQTLLAVLDHRHGLIASAERRLERIRRRLGDEVAQPKWFLKYYTRCQVISAAAVDLYFNACRPGVAGVDAATRDRAASCLQFACAARPGMSKLDLRTRLKWLQTAKTLLPDVAWTSVAEAVAYYRLGSFPRAETTLQACIGRFPRHRDARHWLAKTYLALGRRELAREQWLEVAIEAAGHPEALLDAADGMFAAGFSSEAEELLASATTASPDIHAQAQLVRAKAMLRQDRERDALELLRGATQHSGAVLLLAELLSRQGDEEQAARLLRATISSHTVDPQQRWAMAGLLWNEQKYEEAAAWFDRCGRSLYRQEEAALMQIRCLLRCGQTRQAVEVVQLHQQSLDPAVAAFYHGVALYRDDKPAQALPHFERAYRHGAKAKLNPLVQRSLRNRAACYHRIANHDVRTGQYRQAAKAFEALRKSLKPVHPEYQAVSDNLAESHLRAGIQAFGSAGQDVSAAVGFVEKAIGIWSDTAADAKNQEALRKLVRLRGLLAGLQAFAGRYDNAVAIYEQMQRVARGSESIRFARALCLLRGGNSADGTAELTEIAGGGKFAIRAALALSSIRAEKQEFAAAADMLLTALRSGDNSKNEYYGEACCHVVTYFLRAGQAQRAKDLAAELLGDGKASRADGILGALLAHENECHEALPYLEAGVSADGQRTTGSRLLNGVYRRVAADHCGRRGFGDAKKLLGRAAERDNDPQLQQLFQLVDIASGSKHEMNQETLNILFGIFNANPNPDTVLLRAVGVGYQQHGRDLIRKGLHTQAKPLLTLAHNMWIQRAIGQRVFWTEFVDGYNRGKQYQLDSDVADVEKRILRQIAAFCIGVMKDLLGGEKDDDGYRMAGQVDEPNFDDALFFWNEGKRLAGEQTARELFEEIVQVDKIVSKIDLKKNPLKVRELYLWLCEHVEAKEIYKSQAAELALLEAIQRLKEKQVAQFRALLIESAEANEEIRNVADKVSKLRQSVIECIVDRFAESTHGQLFQITNPAMYGQALLHLVIAYAGSQDQVPGGLQTIHVTHSFDKVVGQVIQNLGKQP